jgi:hypothetical protein
MPHKERQQEKEGEGEGVKAASVQSKEGSRDRSSKNVKSGVLDAVAKKGMPHPTTTPLITPQHVM